MKKILFCCFAMILLSGCATAMLENKTRLRLVAQGWRPADYTDDIMLLDSADGSPPAHVTIKQAAKLDYPKLYIAAQILDYVVTPTLTTYALYSAAEELNEDGNESRSSRGPVVNVRDSENINIEIKGDSSDDGNAINFGNSNMSEEKSE